ncbi:MAG: polysaccharide biosynthesis/export family protein [Rhodomicrobiaceae bacterium]
MRQALNIIAILVAIVVGHGCGAPLSERDDTTAALSGSAAYFLSPGDKLKIKVFDEPDLSGDFQIDEQGKIAFPLVGEIQASGLTLDQFRQSLIQQLQNGYVRTPRITADILNYRPVNIIGEVKNAGQYQYRPGILHRMQQPSLADTPIEPIQIRFMSFADGIGSRLQWILRIGTLRYFQVTPSKSLRDFSDHSFQQKRS